MPHGPLHSAGRRAGGDSALLTPPRPAAPAPLGQHRIPRGAGRRRPPPPQRRARREPQRAMHLLMSGLGALIVLSICGLSGFFVVADDRHTRGPAPAPAPSAPPPPVHDIGSRATDPEPLTTTEVFPEPRITMVPGASPYQVRLRNIDNDCAVATTGRLADLLTRSGCSQVVRATLIAPVEGYPVTAGLFNLPDDATAVSVGRRLKAMVDSGEGSFAGLAVDAASWPVQSASTQVGWHTRGHYLLYCVIARPDGRPVRDDDPYAERIVFDLVESHLRDVVQQRGGSPSA